MPFLVDTDILVDVSRNNPAAIEYVDRLRNDWALSAITALEFIYGAKNQHEVELIDRHIEIYDVIPLSDTIGERAYALLKKYARSNGLAFDSLIAATAIDEKRTLITRNRRHFEMIDGLSIDIPSY